MSGVVVMQTPWNMPTATTSVGRINQQAEERLQRTVTELDMKKRQAVVKMNRKIHEIVEELYHIQKDIDTEAEVELDARCHSTGNHKPVVRGQTCEESENSKGSQSAPPHGTNKPKAKQKWRTSKDVGISGRKKDTVSKTSSLVKQKTPDNIKTKVSTTKNKGNRAIEKR